MRMQPRLHTSQVWFHPRSEMKTDVRQGSSYPNNKITPKQKRMCLKTLVLTENDLRGTVVPCGHYRSVVLMIVCGIAEVHNFDIWVLHCSLIPLLENSVQNTD